MSAPPTKRRRRELTLADKIKLIKESESASLPMKRLAIKYGIGKLTVSDIIKRKADYIGQFEANAGSGRQRFNQTSKFQDVNAVT